MPKTLERQAMEALRQIEPHSPAWVKIIRKYIRYLKEPQTTQSWESTVRDVYKSLMEGEEDRDNSNIIIASVLEMIEDRHPQSVMTWRTK
jgi:hypothetical protein